ncbi:MAG: DUF3737 family protein [archaeon]|nr:DUF3737 family protein [archaeon]
MVRETICDTTFDAERASCYLHDVTILNCRFEGSADGESALKGCTDITVDGCSFSLRCPMWHDRRFRLLYSRMDPGAQAALWYSENGTIEDSVLNGVKAVRECRDVCISRCTISSPEFGWRSDGIRMRGCDVDSEYLFLDAHDVSLRDVRVRGMCSLQYVEGLTLSDCELDADDALWHCRNVVVKDCVLRGERLGWFSENITLENCRICGTRPLCHCRGLRLVNCTMEGCDLSFECSDVEADLVGHVDSIRNPRSGHIVADSVGSVIRDDAPTECSCEILLR